MSPGAETPQRVVPEHVAIILDGNGRWAKRQGLERAAGHRAGAENLDRLLDAFIELGIPYISLYAFSTENWKRPTTEVKAIWSLLEEFFKGRLDRCLEKGIRVMASGERARLPRRVQKRIQATEDLTAANTNMTANFCVNYGSQAEILEACTRVVADRIKLADKGQSRKALRPVKKKTSKNISTPSRCRQ